MDTATLAFINERQDLLRQSYEKYKLEYPATQHASTSAQPISPKAENSRIARNMRNSNNTKYWAWNSWSEDDIYQLVEEFAAKDPDILRQVPSHSSEKSFKTALVRWVKEYMEDTGQSFCLSILRLLAIMLL